MSADQQGVMNGRRHLFLSKTFTSRYLYTSLFPDLGVVTPRVPQSCAPCVKQDGQRSNKIEKLRTNALRQRAAKDNDIARMNRSMTPLLAKARRLPSAP